LPGFACQQKVGGMARRKRKADGSVAMAVLLMVAVVLTGAILSDLAALTRNPAPLVLLPAAGGGPVVWRVSTGHQRARELAEARRKKAESYAARALAIESYHAMDSHEFEEALAYHCRREGCPEAHVTGQAGDLGADGLAATPDGRRLVIHAKRYTPSNMVTAQTCRNSAGHAMWCTAPRLQLSLRPRHQAGEAVCRRMRIALFDNNALADWAARNGPPPWSAVPPPPGPTAPAMNEPRGRHALPSLGELRTYTSLRRRHVL
jgi:restriction system protein